MNLRFEYRNLATDNSDLVALWEVYLRITADFSLLVSGRKIYEENSFPIVEFASLGAEWISSVAVPREDFIYTSVESEDEGLVWIKKEGEKWRVGSVHQERDSSELFYFSEIRESFESFYQSLKTEIMNCCRADIDAVLAWRKAERSHA